MKIRLTALALLIACGAASAAVAPASAQTYVDSVHGVPLYATWQRGWDRNRADHHHVILGTVAAFEPYRLQIAGRHGRIRAIDLKNGTVILPTGATPTVNDRVAAVGYYSGGTFIANRILLRR